MAWMVSNRAVQVVCDDCTVPAQRSGKIIYWPSLARAVAELFSRRWGWLASPDLQLCPGCLARRVCRARGHFWQTVPSGDPPQRPGTARCGRCTTPRSAPWPAGRPGSW